MKQTLNWLWSLREEVLANQDAWTKTDLDHVDYLIKRETTVTMREIQDLEGLVKLCRVMLPSCINSCYSAQDSETGKRLFELLQKIDKHLES